MRASSTESQSRMLWILLIMVVLAIIALILFPVFRIERVRSRQGTCLSNLKCIGLGMLQYSEDYGGQFPPADGWNKSEAVHPQGVLVCPEVREHIPSYALNEEIAGIAGRSLNNAAKVVGVYEAKPGGNTTGGPELLPVPGRHMGGNNIGFVDGHVKWYRDGSYKNLFGSP